MKPMSSNIVPHSARISVLATLWPTAAEGVEKSTHKSSWLSCSATRARARLSRRQIGTITRRRIGGDVWVGRRCTIRSNIMYRNILKHTHTHIYIYDINIYIYIYRLGIIWDYHFLCWESQSEATNWALEMLEGFFTPQPVAADDSFGSLPHRIHVWYIC